VTCNGLRELVFLGVFGSFVYVTMPHLLLMSYWLVAIDKLNRSNSDIAECVPEKLFWCSNECRSTLGIKFKAI